MAEKNKKTFLITGGTGFFGSNLLKNIIARGDELIVLKRSFSNTSRLHGIMNKLCLYDLDKIDIRKVFCDHNIDTIIHCATDYGHNTSNPLGVMEANLTLPLKLLELGKEHKVKCFINTDTILDKRISYYTLSKSQFKQWLTFYAKEIICLNVEFEHFYGPHDDGSKFVTNIVHKLLNQVKAIDLTEGRQKRSFFYIDDAVEAFVKIINSSESLGNRFYNFQVGALETVEIRKFVELAKEVACNNKTVLNFGALPYRKNEIMDPKLNLTKLLKLGWKPKISLAEGLAKTIEVERKALGL